MQTQTTTPEKGKNLEATIRRLYARNHEHMGDFPLFVKQFEKTRAYLAKNPADIEKRVYYTHLLTEIGAVPMVVKQAAGLALAAEPIKPFLLYSLKVALKRCGEEGIIAQYSPFESEEVRKYENNTYVAPPSKKHWWKWQKYEPVKTIYLSATFGEIEFLAAQFGEQKW